MKNLFVMKINLITKNITTMLNYDKVLNENASI